MPMSEQDQQQNNGAQMSPALRQQYLETMGIQCWESRFPEQEVQQQVQSPRTVPADDPLPVSAEPGNSESAITTENSAITELIESPDILNWDQLATAVINCSRCELNEARQSAVAGLGNQDARILVVVQAPEHTSMPSFISGAAKELFSKMLQSIGVAFDQVYFTGVVKCSLPQEREPRAAEIVLCEDYLLKQLELLQPEVILTLGEPCAQKLLVRKKPLEEMNQRFQQYNSVPVMTLHHPDDLLANPGLKRQAWNSLLMVKDKLAS